MEKLSAYLSRLQDGDNEIGSKSLRGNIVQIGGIVRRGSDFNADRKFNLHCGPGRCPCTRQGYIESKLVTSGRAGKACSSISQSNEHGVSRSRGRKRMLIKSITPSFVVGEVERWAAIGKRCRRFLRFDGSVVFRLNRRASLSARRKIKGWWKGRDSREANTNG